MNFNYLEHIKPQFDFLLTERGFALQNCQYDEKHFGNFFIDLESEHFIFRLLNDRSVVTTLLAPISDREDFFDTGLVRALVLKLDPTTMWTLDDEAQFIRSNYDVIKELFDPIRFAATSRQLRRLGAERMANRKRIF